MLKPDPTPSSVRDLAASITGLPCHFVYNTDKQPLSGGECIIYVLESLPTQQKLAIRIPRNRTGPHTQVLIEQEADFRQRVDKAALKYFQPLFRFSSTTENTLKTPFLAIGWVDGRPLKWSPYHPAAENERQDILRAVANASLDLLQINTSGTVRRRDQLPGMKAHNTRSACLDLDRVQDTPEDGSCKQR
jgi:hypothetical protein